MKTYNEVKWHDIIALHNDNYKMTEMAEKLCIPYVTVKRVILNIINVVKSLYNMYQAGKK